jgi:membrane-bound lytic murein transglycosylase B
MRVILAGLILAASALPACAASQSEAVAAVQAAVAAEAAAAPGNRWVPAESALKAAKAAIERQAWDEAVLQAGIARTLALRSVEQSREQETAWHDAVVR